MKIAILSPYPEEITAPIESSGDSWETFERIDDIREADFVVSYGHRHVIREGHLDRFGPRLINLHISYLPWNRGADPNLWSFIDGTPKGVSIHVVDRGMDTGPIISQREVDLSGTLATSYAQLRKAMAELFAETWPLYRDGKIVPRAQTGQGTYHRSADKQAIWSRLPLGFDTKIDNVRA